MRVESRPWPLIGIKVLHTSAWALFVACILGVPYPAWLHRFSLAAVISAAVWCECAVLLLNRGRCPFTDLAARYTTNREPNFDIYLPKWLARWNKVIFGTMFALVEVFYLIVWIKSR